MTQVEQKRWKLWITGLAVIALIFTGCATTKTVSIDSDPQGARIHKGAEYLGDTPLTIEMEEGGALSSKEFFTIKASSRGYQVSTKVIDNKDIPKRLFFELKKEPHASAGTSGGQQQQMQQQMQGPTIVIPGSGGQPVQVTPGETK